MSEDIKKVDAEAINAVANEMVAEVPAKKTAGRKPAAKKAAAPKKRAAGKEAEAAVTQPSLFDEAVPVKESKPAKPRKCAAPRKKAEKAPADAAPKRRGRPAKNSKLIPVSFVYRGLPGMKVFIAGEFNDWDPKVLRMLDPQEVGFYSCEVMLAPGQYQYKLVINGIWREDPDNSMRIRNPFGTDNSLIVVENP